jgi:hypothetical protein
MKSQQIIRKLKLNRGLCLNENKIEPSKEVILTGDGELSISLYEGQPFVYTLINNRKSHENLLSFNSNENEIEFHKDLQFSDICINFPIAEITYTANLSESFSNSIDNDGLYEMYGHLFATKVLIGGKLFIDDFKPATLVQADMFKSLIRWVYDSIKSNEKSSLKNLPFPNFFLKMRTSDGENFNTPEELFNWMNNLYQKDIADIISYNDLVPINELLKSKKLSLNNIQTFDEKQPGIANFKEKLSLDDWVKDSIYVNLRKWIKEFHLFQGLILDYHFKLKNSKKIAIEFNNIPNIYSNNKSYLEIRKPSANLEKIVTLNNNFSVKDMRPFPLNKRVIESDDFSNRDNTHFRVKCEKYKILLDRDDIKPSKEFNQAIENALESMKPFARLQDVFDEYGHFFPLHIYLGKSLKNILPISSSSDIFGPIDIATLDLLESYLDKFNVSNLLTQEGNIIEKENIKEWIQKADHNLEIIEYDKLICLYEILEAEQQRKVEVILNIKDDLKIILTGIDDLKDLDIGKDDQNYCKRINIEPSFEDYNYKVLGSIISKDNTKLEGVFVTFESYDTNGFSAKINKSSSSETDNVNLKECYILWMIIGNPLKLSVFSPKNRDCQVNHFSITLKPNQLNYHIATPTLLSPRHAVFFRLHSANSEFENAIKLISWSYNFIDIEITKSIPEVISADDEYKMDIYIISSDYKNLIIDDYIKKMEYSFDLIGYNLTKNNFIEGMFINKLLILFF